MEFGLPGTRDLLAEPGGRKPRVGIDTAQTAVFAVAVPVLNG